MQVKLPCEFICSRLPLSASECPRRAVTVSAWRSWHRKGRARCAKGAMTSSPTGSSCGSTRGRGTRLACGAACASWPSTGSPRASSGNTTSTASPTTRGGCFWCSSGFWARIRGSSLTIMRLNLRQFKKCLWKK